MAGIEAAAVGRAWAARGPRLPGPRVARDPRDPIGQHPSVAPATLVAMTDAPMPARRPYSPGLEGIVAGETSLGYVDGERGRLLYRGYRIGDLVDRGTYPAVANLLWTGEWDPGHRLPTAPVPGPVLTVLRALPATTKPMDALRTAVSAWGATQDLPWPPTAEQARALTSFSPSALAAFARLRAGAEPVEPDPSLDLVDGFLYQLTGERPDPATARALDAYFIVGSEHGFNASTFTARIVTSTRSDIASAVAAAIGTLKGPLHGGAPSEVVDQLNQIGSADDAEAWVREALGRGERLMGFGHRVYRAYDPRAAALRKVAEAMPNRPDWLQLAIDVEDVSLRVLAEKHPERALKTNVEYYAAPVLMGVGLTPDLFPAAFSLARHAGWTAHILEQAADNRLIRPDVNYIGPAERDLPA
jgi:citrate synthase